VTDFRLVQTPGQAISRLTGLLSYPFQHSNSRGQNQTLDR